MFLHLPGLIRIGPTDMEMWLSTGQIVWMPIIGGKLDTTSLLAGDLLLIHDSGDFPKSETHQNFRSVFDGIRGNTISTRILLTISPGGPGCRTHWRQDAPFEAQRRYMQELSPDELAKM